MKMNKTESETPSALISFKMKRRKKKIKVITNEKKRNVPTVSDQNFTEVQPELN